MLHTIVKILCFLLLFLSVGNVYATPKEDGSYFLNDQDWFRKKRKMKGDTLLHYEVLRLKGIDNRNRYMVVFARAVIDTRKSEALLKIRYFLKRERGYLGKIFFTKVDILERRSSDETPYAITQELGKKYANIVIWSVLEVNQLASKIHPR